MIEKRTTISQIEVVECGHIQVRLSKQIVEDGKVLMSEYHRTICECGGDIDAQLAAVNAHLGTMGYAPISAADCARIKAIAAADWTPQRRAAWALQRDKLSKT